MFLGKHKENNVIACARKSKVEACVCKEKKILKCHKEKIIKKFKENVIMFFNEISLCCAEMDGKSHH